VAKARCGRLLDDAGVHAQRTAKRVSPEGKSPITIEFLIDEAHIPASSLAVYKKTSACSGD